MTSHVRRQALYELLQRKAYWADVVRDRASTRMKATGLSDEYKEALLQTEQFFRKLMEEDERLIGEFIRAIREEMESDDE